MLLIAMKSEAFRYFLKVWFFFWQQTPSHCLLPTFAKNAQKAMFSLVRYVGIRRRFSKLSKFIVRKGKTPMEEGNKQWLVVIYMLHFWRRQLRVRNLMHTSHHLWEEFNSDGVGLSSSSHFCQPAPAGTKSRQKIFILDFFFNLNQSRKF